MAAQVLDARILISARDAASGVFNRVGHAAGRAKRELAGIGKTAIGIGGLGLLAGAAYKVGDAIGASIKKAKEWETVGIAYGNIVGLQGAALDAYKDKLLDLAPAMGRTKDEALKVSEVMAGRGVKQDLIDKALPGMLKFQTATRTTSEDIGSLGTSLVDTFGISDPEDFRKTLDGIAVASKRGGVEAKDMSKDFARVGAAAANAGMKGRKGAIDLAAMQEVGFKTSGTAEGAARGAFDYINKLSSPQQIKQMKKWRIDIEKERAKALKDGESFPIHMAKLLKTKIGSDPAKVNKLFPEADSRNMYLALVKYMDELESIRTEAMNANGTVEADANRVLASTGGILDQMTAKYDTFSTTAGEAILKDGGVNAALKELNETLFGVDRKDFGQNVAGGVAKMLDGINDLVEEVKQVLEFLDKVEAKFNDIKGVATKPMVVDPVRKIKQRYGPEAGLDPGHAKANRSDSRIQKALDEATVLATRKAIDEEAKRPLGLPPIPSSEDVARRRGGGRLTADRIDGKLDEILSQSRKTVTAGTAVPPLPAKTVTAAVPGGNFDAIFNSLSSQIKDAIATGPQQIDLSGATFPAGSLNNALSGKVEAVVTQPVTADLKGQASVNVNVRVTGPAQVTGITTSGGGHLAKPRVGTDTTGRPASERF